MPAAVDVLRLPPERYADFHRAAAVAFMEPIDEQLIERFARVVEVDRSWVALERQAIVGTATSYSLKLSVPGGELGCAGVTWLTVLPTHRRRGIFRQLLGRLFDDAQSRGEPVAALWASAGGIYGRFGFGPAAFGDDLQLALPGPAVDPPLADDEPRPRLITSASVVPLLAPVYERVMQMRPGLSSRTTAWWESRVVDAAEHNVVVEDDDGYPRGYVLYKTQGLPPDVKVEVVELMALDASAARALWRYLCSLELASSITAVHRPVDDPLPFLLADIRSVERVRRDCLWLRLLDLPRALTERRWASAVSLTLRVHDATLSSNDGIWRLETVAGEGALCTPVPSSQKPDLVLDASVLGSVYLGGVTVTEMLGAGLVEEPTSGAVATLDDALRTARAPWAPEHF
jgi:predicted acetyltransferase